MLVPITADRPKAEFCRATPGVVKGDIEDVGETLGVVKVALSTWIMFDGRTISANPTQSPRPREALKDEEALCK